MRNQLKTILLLGVLSSLVVAVAAAFGATAAWVGVAAALALNIGAYFWSDRLVLRMHGAREAPSDMAPRAHRMVREIAARAGMPPPRLFLIEDRQPNAFATGRNPAHGVVAVTTGILDLLDDRELRGVLAHEIAHIRNRDVLLATIAATLAAVLTWAAKALSLASLFGRSDESSESGGASGGFLMVLVAPLAGTLVQLGISRAREYAADETGAALCSDPEALASALLTLDRGADVFAAADPQPATASLFIVNPLRGRSRLLRLFSTHPSTEERVRRLREMARRIRTSDGPIDPLGATG